MTDPLNDKVIAVLTGDLVRSTRLDHDGLVQARETLLRSAAEIEDWGRGEVYGPEFFRGDSWQLVLTDEALWLRAAIFLRTALRALDRGADTRIAIGVGGYDVLERTAASRSVGEAFTLSGHALDGMGRGEGFKLAVARPSAAQTYLPTVLSFCSHVIGAWSPSQARVALELLRPDAGTQEEVGEALGVSRQFVNKVHRQSGLSSVLMALEVFEARS